MDRYLNISDVITQLKTDSTITWLLGTRIYERPLPNESSKEDGVFLTIKNLDQSTDDVHSNPLLNFVFIGNTRAVTYDTLNNIASEVFDYIRDTSVYSWFRIYKTGLLRKFPHWQVKSQRYIQFDLRFYHST